MSAGGVANPATDGLLSAAAANPYLVALQADDLEAPAMTDEATDKRLGPFRLFVGFNGDCRGHHSGTQAPITLPMMRNSSRMGS